MDDNREDDVLNESVEDGENGNDGNKENNLGEDENDTLNKILDEVDTSSDNENNNYSEDENKLTDENLSSENDENATGENESEYAEGESVLTDFEEEPEKAKPSVTKVISICLAVVIVIAGGIIGFRQIANMGKNYILTFNGQKISIEDFKLFYIFSDATGEEAKQGAVDSLTQYLILEKALKDRNITLTEEESETLKANVTEMKDYITSYELSMPNITDKRLEEILSIDLLSEKLFDSVAVNYVIDEEDYQSELEIYVLYDKQYYTETTLRYILTETEEAAEIARNAVLNDGMEFDDAVKEHSIDYSEEYGVGTISLSQIYLDEDVAEHLLSLNVDDVSDVVNLSYYEMYGVFLMDYINVPSEEEIEASFRDLYTEQKEYELFEAEFLKWQNESSVVLNQKAFDSIE